MSFPSYENLFPKRLKKQSCVLDLNESPPTISYEKEHTLSENFIPKMSTICSHGLKASVNMVEGALAAIPLSFKRQETAKSSLVIEKGILTLVQHQAHDQEHDQQSPGTHKRGLRTSWTEHYVDGHFELPTECVKYILIRDKYRQRLSRLIGKRLLNPETRRFHISVHNRLEGWRVETRKRPDKTHDKFYHHCSSGRMFRSLVEVEKFIKYEIYPPKTTKAEQKLHPKQDHEELVIQIALSFLSHKRKKDVMNSLNVKLQVTWIG